MTSRRKILDAKAEIEEAMASLSAIWQEDSSVRTPRLAEAVSLLERAARKIEMEAEAQWTIS